MDYTEHSKSLLPSDESQSGVIEYYGEVVAATNLIVVAPSSSGGTQRLNMSATNLDRLQEYTVGSFTARRDGEIDSIQNRTAIHGELIQCSADLLLVFLPTLRKARAMQLRLG
jgi:hypothetical protein